MRDTEALDLLLTYIEDSYKYIEALKIKASSDVSHIYDAELAVIDDILNYAEKDLGLKTFPYADSIYGYDTSDFDYLLND